MILLIDMNLSPRWVAWLAQHDVEAHHWSEVGDPRASDQEIMAHAHNAGLLVLTHDLDFGTMLAASGRRDQSVVQLRTADVRPEICGPLVLAALRTLAVELSEGALVTIDVRRTRVDILPVKSPR